MKQSDNRHRLNVIISGGGTGGHIFPAIAIANALKNRVPDVNILFIGAKGKMEMEKVPAAGYPIEGLWISGLQRKLTLKNLAFPLKVISSMIKARKIIRRFKPDIVIGVGGFASGPTLRVASNMGILTCGAKIHVFEPALKSPDNALLVIPILVVRAIRGNKAALAAPILALAALSACSA